MRIPKVSNMESPRTGNKVANQYIIQVGKEFYFQSYQTIIARKYLCKSDNCGQWHIQLDPDYDYSRTTMKYLSQFLFKESMAEIRKNIKDGIYSVRNLNK